MGCGAISGDSFTQQRLTQQIRCLANQPFNPSMLEAQYDLQVDDLFTVADKTETARFDDPCMNRSYVHLMQRFATNRIERIVIQLFRAIGSIMRKTQRFCPRMVDITHSELFDKLSLKRMDSRITCCQRRNQLLFILTIWSSGHLVFPVSFKKTGDDHHLSRSVIQHQAVEPQRIRFRHSEIGGDMATLPLQSPIKLLKEIRIRQYRNLLLQNTSLPTGYFEPLIHSKLKKLLQRE